MTGIPHELIGVSVGVLLYSSINLFLCSMLVGLLISYGDTFTYVTIQSTFTAVSTLASIIQQFHYAFYWSAVKEAQYQKALRAVDLPGLTFVGGASPADRTLYLIQFWCYNVMSLNILFWSIALFTSTWGIRAHWLGDLRSHIEIISKIFSVIFPSLIVGLLYIDGILVSAMGTFVVSNFTMFVCLISGSVFLLLILTKYIRTRRLAVGHSQRGRWWASHSTKSQGSQDIGSYYTTGTGTRTVRSSIYDRALIIRFSIGFVITGFFLAAIIVFSYVASTTNVAIVAAGRPDLGIDSARTEILLFLPGVTASLVTFLVFGTAKSWRQYRDLLVGGCGIRNKLLQRRFIRQQESDGRRNNFDQDGLEFAPLPALHMTPGLEERLRKEEATKRVKMFSTTTTIITAGDPPPPPPPAKGRKWKPSNVKLDLEEDLQSSGTATSKTWDTHSIEDTTVYNERVDNDNAVLPHPLTARPAQHQQRPSLSSQRTSSQNVNFHRPRPSLSRTQVGSSMVPVSAYGSIRIAIEKEDSMTPAAVQRGTYGDRFSKVSSPVGNTGRGRSNSFRPGSVA